jgi:metal-responsive CopG/Arc/MetJ family transcriptional regulator
MNKFPRGANATPRIQIVASDDWTAQVDEWRRTQPDIPSRSEAIRRLVQAQLEQHNRKRLVRQQA